MTRGSLMLRIPKPAPDEHLPYYGKYIALVGDDALSALREQERETVRLLTGVDDTKALHRYATGKWSVKEVLGHVIDGERVFSYRALRIARRDRTPMPGFDENQWVPAGAFDARRLVDLVSDFQTTRAATLALFSSFDEEALTERGIANGAEISVRALAHIIAGHELHHRGLLRERYGLA
jgi:uncharacterized damage-inducible protein DinB